MITRRHALRALGAVCALPCLEACASQRSFRTGVENNSVRVPAEQLSHLRESYDTLTVRTGQNAPILVRRLADGQFIAVDARCPHSGCKVQAEPEGYVCPCHGSAFGTGGELLAGPAQQALRRYPADLDGDTLVIRLS